LASIAGYHWAYMWLGFLCELAAVLLSLYIHKPSTHALAWVSMNGVCFSVSFCTNLWVLCKKKE
jgi:hypothetical protein